MSNVSVSTDEMILENDFLLRERPGCEGQSNRELLKLGIFTSATLEESIKRDARKPFLIEGLLGRGSVNLLVGDSGLGKTPLSAQIGMCVAAGLPVFGRSVQQGPVLYCDAESGKHDFYET